MLIRIVEVVDSSGSMIRIRPASLTVKSGWNNFGVGLQIEA
jgi:hypothetical protein